MDFIYKEKPNGRRTLTEANSRCEKLDSYIMSQRGQDFQAAYDEIAANPEHTITVYVPPVIEE